MKSKDALREFAERQGWRAVLDRYRDRYGKRASRELANRYGVSQRTAQRALKGDTRSPKFTQTNKFKKDQAADAVRSINVAHAGHVQVSYDDKAQGSRNIGDRYLGDEAIDAIVDQLTEGEDDAEPNWEAAGNELDAAILDQYGGLSSALAIEDYEDGLTFD